MSLDDLLEFILLEVRHLLNEEIAFLGDGRNNLVMMAEDSGRTSVQSQSFKENALHPFLSHRMI